MSIPLLEPPIPEKESSLVIADEDGIIAKDQVKNPSNLDGVGGEKQFDDYEVGFDEGDEEKQAGGPVGDEVDEVIEKRKAREEEEREKKRWIHKNIWDHISRVLSCAVRVY